MENLIKDFIKNPSYKKLDYLRSIGCKCLKRNSNDWMRLESYQDSYLLDGCKIPLYKKNEDGKIVAFAIGYF